MPLFRGGEPSYFNGWFPLGSDSHLIMQSGHLNRIDCGKRKKKKKIFFFSFFGLLGLSFPFPSCSMGGPCFPNSLIHVQFEGWFVKRILFASDCKVVGD